jgi:hypothetical protein
MKRNVHQNPCAGTAKCLNIKPITDRDEAARLKYQHDLRETILIAMCIHLRLSAPQVPKSLRINFLHAITSTNCSVVIAT